MPLGFRTAGSDRLVPTYPIGLPLFIAGFAWVTGWTSAANLVMVFHALAGVVLIVCLARACHLSRYIAMVSALLLATSPMYLFMSLTLMSDIPALVWTTATVLLAWRSRKNPDWALGCGVAASLAVLIRPTNILILVPVAVNLGISPRRWGLFVLGGLPGVVLLASYNVAAYGAAATTGYGDFRGLFGIENVIPSLRSYLVWLPIVLTPTVTLAFGLPALLSKARRPVTVLLLWILAFLVFYALYSYTSQEWWYARFLLPAFPPLVVSALWVGSVVAGHLRTNVRLPTVPQPFRLIGARLVLTLLPALIVAHNIWWGRHLKVLQSGSDERTYLEVAEWSRFHLPPNAVIVAMQVSGAFFYYTDFTILRWDQVNDDVSHRIELGGIEGRWPLYAVLLPYDRDLNAFGHLPGRWVQVGTIKDASVWRFDR
jgi:hypothetical protein